MSPISDQELQRHLARRTTMTMPPADREDVLAAVAGARARPRFSFRMRPSLLLAPIAALVLVVLVAVPLLWTLAPGPGPSPSPSSGAVTIYTAQQLSDMIGDPAWVGHYVIGQAQLAYIRGATQCVAPDLCANAYLVGVSGKNVVSVGWRDAPEGQGTHLADGEWVQPLTLPQAVTVSTFEVASDTVEFLGPAKLAPGDAPMTTAGAGSPSQADPVDDVYVVSGWLTEPLPPGCPTSPPGNGDGSWACDGSWLTPTDQRVTAFSSPTDGLHTQNGAYADFAPDPQYADNGPTPRFGTYLVRPAGTAETLEGQSPVWRMVGRLDQALEPAPSESIGPSPSPPPSLSPLDVLTQDQLIALAQDPLAAGRVVIARAQLSPVPVPSASEACAPPDACYVGQIGVDPGVTVYSGWRDATIAGEGIYDLTEGRWFVRLDPPSMDEHAMAFRIGHGSVEYLGDAQSTDGSLAWSVDDLLAVSSPSPDQVYAVSGWLVRTQDVPCPSPGAGTDVDLNYYCGGSFITATATAISESQDAVDPGGIHVQQSAFADFAPNPTSIEIGNGPPAWTSDPAVYLVRIVREGTPALHERPEWRLVGRLDEPATNPTPSPSPTPSTQNIDVLTQDQLVALSYDPSAKDRVVIADAQIDLAPVASADCTPFDPCYLGHIGHNPSAAVYEGWREATSEGTGTFDTSQGRWLVRLGLPSAAEHTMAFRIGHDTVEYLGDAQPSNGSFVWSVNDLLAQSALAPDQVFAVDGWLVRTQQVPCPTSPPGAGGSPIDGNYECGGSFITATQTAISETQNDLDPGGLHVQAGAYGAFAPNPTQIDVGLGPPAGTSDQAVFLVRFVGPRSTIMGRANVWRVVGRLDQQTGTTEPAPSPSPTPAASLPTSINGQPVLSTDDAQQQIEAGYSGSLLIAGQVKFHVFYCAAVDPIANATQGLISGCPSGFWIEGISGSTAGIQLFGGPSQPFTEGVHVVVRVHTHDPVAANCPEAFIQRCREAAIVDAIVWPAPSATPTSAATEAPTS